MALYLAWCDGQAVGDVGVAVAVDEQDDDFSLARGELFGEPATRFGFAVNPLEIRLVFVAGRRGRDVRGRALGARGRDSRCGAGWQRRDAMHANQVSGD